MRGSGVLYVLLLLKASAIEMRGAASVDGQPGVSGSPLPNQTEPVGNAVR